LLESEGDQLETESESSTPSVVVVVNVRGGGRVESPARAYPEGGGRTAAAASTKQAKAGISYATELGKKKIGKIEKKNIRVVLFFVIRFVKWGL
jgi:hypothetical protein